MNLSSVQRAEAEFLLPTYERFPVMFTRGRGVYLWDSTGKKYLDLLSGIGVNALGHGNPAIQKVLKRQAGQLMHISNLFFHEFQAQLAKQLTKISGLDRAFFCNSGTEAWEAALKLARAYSHAKRGNGNNSKFRILALDNSFHGRTFGSLATTGQPKYREPFVPLLPGVSFVGFNDLDDLKWKFDDNVCAVCLETVQGEGGILPVSDEFLKLARKLTEQNDALLILDEIQCGLGRTGRYFAYQHYGVQPDVVTVAKPLAAGLPLGAVLTTNKVSTCIHPGMHGTTFGGGPLACAVAVEFLRQLKGLLPQINKVGGYFHQQIKQLKDKHPVVREVRGLGMMLAMDLESADAAKAVAKRLLDEGILISRTHDTVLRFLPPYILEKKHVDHAIHALDAALSAVPVTMTRQERPTENVMPEVSLAHA
ncbi:MAG TPA: aspartate aminotransferase family protein [Terriglobales bacterium]|nr:aspartate aminotransferase family protein [Terriglobales bacterium]